MDKTARALECGLNFPFLKVGSFERLFSVFRMVGKEQCRSVVEKAGVSCVLELRDEVLQSSLHLPKNIWGLLVQLYCVSGYLNGDWKMSRALNVMRIEGKD